MGVLDDIKAELSGSTGLVTETVIPTQVPPKRPERVMDKIAREMTNRNAAEEQADFAERVNSFVRADPNQSITMPKPGQPMQRPDLPITVTARPPVNGVAQDPANLDIFQRYEIQKQLDERAKNLVGPPAPPKLNMTPPSAGDILGHALDEIGKSFTEKGNPYLGAMANQYRQEGLAGVLTAIPQVATGLPTAVAGFIGSTASWASATAKRILEGQNVLDAIHEGRSEGNEFAEFLSKRVNPNGVSPIAEGIMLAVPPMSAFAFAGEALDQTVGVFTKDERVKSAAQLLFSIAILGGGAKAISYIKRANGAARGAFDIIKAARDLAELATEGGADPKVALVANAAAAELGKSAVGSKMNDKFGAAVKNIVSRMTDEHLARTRVEMQSPRAVDNVDNPEQRQVWVDAIDSEISKRAPKPIIPGEFAVPGKGGAGGDVETVRRELATQELDRLGKLREEEANRISVKEGGSPFVFNNGAVMKTDAAGRQVSGGIAPRGKEYFDNLANGKIPLPEDLVQPPGTRIFATSKNTAGQIASHPLSGKDRVDRLMAMVPFMKPRVSANGYIRVLAPGHPLAAMGDGTVALHRLIWEQFNDKRAAPWEEVHHKNEVVDDNRPENLELEPTKEAHQAVHAGRVPTAEESAFPLDFDRSLNPRPMTEMEKKQQADLLNGASTVAGLGYRYSDIVPPERGKPGRKTNASTPPPGPPAPEAPETLRYPGPPNDRLVNTIQKRGAYYVEPARQSTIENGGSTFNPIKGDMGMTDHYVSGIVPEATVKYPGRDVPPAVIDQFWKDNAATIASDPQHLGVGTWFNEQTPNNPTGDNMTHIDIVATIHATEENGRAAVDYLGRKYKQIEVTNLKDFSGWSTGGDGKTIDPNWMPPQERMFDPELRRIMGEKPTEPGAGEPPAGTTPPAEVPPAGAPPTTPPPAGEALAAADDPAVQLLDALQSPGLTIQPEGQARTFRERSEAWVRHWLDRFYPVHKYTAQAIKIGGKMLQGLNPSLMIKAGWLAGVTGRAEALIFKGGFKTDIYGMNNPTGMKPLAEIYKPFHGDMEGFDKFLVYRAAIEEEGLNRFRKPTDWVNTGVDLDEAKAYVDANEAKYGAGAKEFTKYFHSLLGDLEDSGLIDPEFAAELRSKRPNYAPLRRDMEALGDILEAGGNKGIKATLDRVTSPLRTRLGSDRPILPPTQSAIIMTYEIVNAVQRQNVARAIVDLRSHMGMEDIITQIFPGPKGEVPSGPDVVMVRNAGKAEYFKVPQDLADSMKMIHEAGLGEWTKRLSIPSRWLRTGATSAPGFAVRNPIRDWQTAFINSKAGFNPITDFTKGLFHLIMKDDSYWRWKQSGAEWSMLVTLDKDMASEAIREMHAETSSGIEAFKAKWIKSPLAYLEKLSELGEKPTRMGVFERARAKGMSDMEAAAESRSASTDFAVRGAKSKAIASLYTFLNARAQTTYKLAQTAKEHPGQFIIRGLASAAVPTILLYALNRDDPEYWKRSKQERAVWWFLPMRIGGRQVKIPKGEIGIIFGNAVEAALEAMDSTPEGRMKVSEYLNGVFQAVSPIGNIGETMPTFMRPVAEWVNNRKYYSGTDIENETDKGKAPYLRYGPYTSETAKAVGQALGAFNKGEGVSPKKMENALYGLTGGVGRMTVSLVDWLSGIAGILPRNEKPKEPFSGTPLRPVMQGFLSQRAQGFESEPARVFYAADEALRQTRGTLDSITGRVRGNTESEKAAWIKAHPEEMSRINEELKIWITNHPNEMELMKISTQGSKDLFLNARTELSALRKLENSVASDTTMDAKAKRKALDGIDKRVSELVDPLWHLINAASQKVSKRPGS
jgi:hypothetical protein